MSKKEFNPSVLFTASKNGNGIRAYLSPKNYNAIMAASEGGTLLFVKLSQEEQDKIAAKTESGTVPTHRLVILPAMAKQQANADI